MTEQQRAQCPVCGRADVIVSLRGWQAEQEVRQAEAREAAARRVAAPATGSSPDEGSGSQSLDPLPVIGEEVILGLVGLGLRAAWRQLAWNPIKNRALPALASRHEEIIQRFFSAIDRHPDLWLCQRDEVVFRAGGLQAAPARDAMRWLRNGDDAKLDGALYRN